MKKMLVTVGLVLASVGFAQQRGDYDRGHDIYDQVRHLHEEVRELQNRVRNLELSGGGDARVVSSACVCQTNSARTESKLMLTSMMSNGSIRNEIVGTYVNNVYAWSDQVCENAKGQIPFCRSAQ